MIRLDRLELLHWDLQRHQELPLAPGVNVLTGENGSGKTSILDAIKIVLGADRLGSERSVNDYLHRQGAPVAMIRVLVDNRPHAETGRRPFHRLVHYVEDSVTLAVVFRAEDDEGYSRRYYMLDGNRVPSEIRALAAKAPSAKSDEDRPFPSREEYRRRLKEVGVGRAYRQLLSLPQGEISRLCRLDEAGLFDTLYDVIGGRDVLEAWEERLRELAETQRATEAARGELDAHERDLRLLEERVARHRKFLEVRGSLAALENLLPHLRLAEARETLRLLGERKTANDAARTAHGERKRRLDEACAALDEQEMTRAAEAVALRAERDRRDEELHALSERHVETRLRREELDALREEVRGVVPADPERLEGELAELRTDEAVAEGVERERRRLEKTLRDELASLRKGLLPMPDEVEAFRAVLRRAAIPHHLLAEVLECHDEGWARAVEAYLGRRRFAVLVQDPAQWPEAARLAREAGYGPGVLAPDVRGSSPRDAEGLFSILEVKEKGYRALLARLLRPVLMGEPPAPLSPLRRGELLAPDGFVLSRSEARTVHADRRYLGRGALEERKATLEAALVEHAARAAAHVEARTGRRKRAAELEAALAAQRRRLLWESRRDEHETLTVALARLDEEVLRQKDGLRACRDRLDEALAHERRIELERRPLEHERGAVEQGLKGLDDEARRLAEARVEAESLLGRLMAEEPAPLSDEARRMGEEGATVPQVETLLRERSRSLEDVPEADRDPLLPENHRRQEAEFFAVKARFAELAETVEACRKAADEAKAQFHLATRRVFRAYFRELEGAAAKLDFAVTGRVAPLENGRFRCELQVAVGDKAPVHYNSERLSGGQKAALSILLGMSAVALSGDDEAVGFFLIDEPFSASDLNKINELGAFLHRSGAQYLVSMPTSSDLARCGDWLAGTWHCTRTRGGYHDDGRPRLAPPVKVAFARRDEETTP